MAAIPRIVKIDYIQINLRLRTLFRSHQYLTSPQKTKEQLERGHRWLDIFEKARKDDAHSRRLMDRYDRLLEIKTTKERWKQIFDKEMEWSKKMSNRAILTGSIVRPTIYNKPFPRMRPQPIHVSRMIHSRRRARERRGERRQLLLDYKNYIRQEQFFEYKLSQNVQSRGSHFTPIFESLHEWCALILGPLDAALDEIQKSYTLDDARSKSTCSPELLAQVKEARREKIRNKTREKRREQRGEILNHTIGRMRQGPPAPLLALMTDEEKKIDRLIRSPSEGGYTGMMKRKAGVKLKDDHLWRLEDGLKEMQPKLEEMEKEFYALQEEKRNKSNSNTNHLQ
ncbi:hypothetical protein Clacol_005984 [Clathrus columnatus]|uniref:Uncharacterized protein n=1 Tax=Clathrus columnatus TaxID=1419009 RepID=A0AAV5AAT4_9AGAM|nr:hypothetical protein Clacol_005984 [Clathrus columnatus]